MFNAAIRHAGPVGLCLTLFLLVGGCAMHSARLDVEPTPPQRINALSPWYDVDPADLDLFIDYCATNTRTHERQVQREILPEVQRMIAEADDTIIACFFLFDCLYSDDEPPARIAEQLAAQLIARKQADPDLTVVLILDLIHRGWGHRRSPLVEQLHDAGVEVFYSDLLGTRSATRFPIYEGLSEIGRFIDKLTFDLSARIVDGIGSLPIPGTKFDDQPITLSTIGNALHLKANHRKLLVTVSGEEHRAMVTSWNPHNPSANHENHAVTVSGTPARYIYNVLREDIRASIDSTYRYRRWATRPGPARKRFLIDAVPEAPMAEPPPAALTSATDRVGIQTAQVSVATEAHVETRLLEMLDHVEPGDQVRIQMFYLSRPRVLHALLDAAARSGEPVRILLDPNRTGINYAKDGTPNAQAADYLMQRAEIEGVPILIRWYATSGEQNHAKSMSITNPQTGKHELVVGSANWTRKNLANINLEANLFIRNAPHLNHRFDAMFDRFWFNRDADVVYSLPRQDPSHDYDAHAGRWWWAERAKLLWLIPLNDERGRPRLMEKELVHW